MRSKENEKLNQRQIEGKRKRRKKNEQIDRDR
jgi:hypothetical protein